MDRENNSKCKSCGAKIRYYDTVKRIQKGKFGKITYLYVSRFRCERCGEIHRKLPDGLYPYKHYDAEIIKGVIDHLITPETLEYEDYPCETTMKRWTSQHKQALL